MRSLPLGAADNDHRYIIFLYKTSTFSGELRSSDEGEIFRVKLSELDPAEFSDGFAEMLEVFTDEHLSEVITGSTARNGELKTNEMVQSLRLIFIIVIMVLNIIFAAKWQ